MLTWSQRGIRLCVVVGIAQRVIHTNSWLQPHVEMGRALIITPATRIEEHGQLRDLRSLPRPHERAIGSLETHMASMELCTVQLHTKPGITRR